MLWRHDRLLLNVTNSWESKHVKLLWATKTLPSIALSISPACIHLCIRQFKKTLLNAYPGDEITKWNGLCLQPWRNSVTKGDARYHGECHLWNQTNWIPTVALPLSSYFPLNKLLHASVSSTAYPFSKWVNMCQCFIKLLVVGNLINVSYCHYCYDYINKNKRLFLCISSKSYGYRSRAVPNCAWEI